MTTTAWTSRVGTVWTRPHHPDVEIRGEHPHAGLVKLDDQWIPIHELEANYVQACCSECGEPLSAMRKLLVDEANRNSPSPYVKAVPGSYCTGPCCWPPRAPATC